MNILLVDDERHALQEMEDAVSVALPEAQRFSFQRLSEALVFTKTTPTDIALVDINMHYKMLYMGDVFSAYALTVYWPDCKIIYCIDDNKYVNDVSHIRNSVYLLKPITAEKVQTVLDNLNDR